MPVMSPLESTLWYLSLPLLIYVSWRFVLLNTKQYHRVHPPSQDGSAQTDPPAAPGSPPA